MVVTGSSPVESRAHRWLDWLRRGFPEILILIAILSVPGTFLLKRLTDANASGGTTRSAGTFATFDLALAKVDWDRETLRPGDDVVINVVAARKDGTPPAAPSDIRFSGARFVKVVDASGIEQKPPYPSTALMRIALPRGDQDATAIKFADLLGNASRILVLPQ